MKDAQFQKKALMKTRFSNGKTVLVQEDIHLGTAGEDIRT